MIGVAVGIEDGIHAGELVAQGLLAKIGAGVDQHDADRECRRAIATAPKAAGGDRADQSDVHTAQPHPSVGTPMEVPVPRNVSRPSIPASVFPV